MLHPHSAVVTLSMLHYISTFLLDFYQLCHYLQDVIMQKHDETTELKRQKSPS